jgi:Ca-activated chloride channel family protein
MGFQRSVIFLVAGALLSSGLHAQQAVPTPAAEATSDSGGTIRVTTDVVLVPVLVMDRFDQFITGLRKDDFELYDNRVRQDIRYFTSEDVPVSATLLLDTSGSMARKMAMASMAVRDFLMASNPEDEFSLIQFNDKPRVLVPFTADHGKIARWLPLFEPHGWTALLDAIDLALNEMKHARYARKAIFIISDGGDNFSRHTATEVLRRVTEADVQIYSIGIFNPFESDEQSGAALLKTMARVTGGRLYKVNDPNVLPETAKTIGAALRNEYVLGYSPSGEKGEEKSDGKYHRIEVKLTRPQESTNRLTSFRSSYLAPSR